MQNPAVRKVKTQKLIYHEEITPQLTWHDKLSSGINDFNIITNLQIATKQLKTKYERHHKVKPEH